MCWPELHIQQPAAECLQGSKNISSEYAQGEGTIWGWLALKYIAPRLSCVAQLLYPARSGLLHGSRLAAANLVSQLQGWHATTQGFDLLPASIDLCTVCVARLATGVLGARPYLT